MSDKIHVLITDDEPFNLELMEEILEDDYKVDCVSSGQECLSFLAQYKPDLLLLDVAMPHMNGYEVCERIKGDPDLTLPVLFVSARATLEERMAGYEAGGDDYLIKPFDNQELLAKIANLVEFVGQKKTLNKQIKQANEMAMMVMSNSGEIGVIINFLKESFGQSSFKALSQTAFDALEQFGLESTLQYTSDNQVLGTFDSSGIYKPVESELLELTRKKGRIFHYNKRSIFNFSHSSLLIKNMPKEDEDRCGRLLDHLCLLMEGLNAIVSSILKEEEIQAFSELNQSIILSTKQRMLEIKETISQQKNSAINIGQKLMSQLESDLLTLGLDNDQEKYLVGLIDKNIAELNAVYDNQEAIEAFFNDVIHSLNR